VAMAVVDHPAKAVVAGSIADDVGANVHARPRKENRLVAPARPAAGHGLSQGGGLAKKCAEAAIPMVPGQSVRNSVSAASGLNGVVVRAFDPADGWETYTYPLQLEAPCGMPRCRVETWRGGLGGTYL
jgi:hypothetical protein